MRHQPARRVPPQLLGGQPAHALDERAFHLADVDGRVDRAAGIVQHVGAQQAPFAGQRVDHHFRDRRAVGEVVERAAMQPGLIPVQLGRGVEAVGPQLHARHVGQAHQLVERYAALTLLGPDLGVVVGEGDGLDGHVVVLRGEGGQALADLARGILRGLAVQVAAGGGRGGGRVGDLAGVGGRHAHAAEGDAQLMRHHLRDLGVQALAHLGAAVVHQDGAVVVHVHQRAGLVEVPHVERDAELHRRQRQAALEHRAGRVEGAHGLAAGAVVGRGFQFVEQFVDDVVFHGLAVRRDVVPVLAVQVGAAHIQRVASERARDVVQDGLDGERALRPAEAAEGRVRLRVGARAEAVDLHLGQPVGVVEVADGARHHRAGQVGREARARGHVDLHAEDAAVVVVAGFVRKAEVVPLAGDHHVVVAVGAQLHRAGQLPRGQRGAAGEQRRLRFLAAEAAAHAPAFHQHLVGMPAQHVRHGVLHLGRMLRRAPHVHAVVFLRHGI